ncbi:hypothetical protein C8R42DRAFT_718884 [Lentinula raphanica]|nr:hypothetical protein C8R42DRAFT_718884 [Lentinula raphanica]
MANAAACTSSNKSHVSIRANTFYASSNTPDHTKYVFGYPVDLSPSSYPRYPIPAAVRISSHAEQTITPTARNNVNVNSKNKNVNNRNKNVNNKNENVNNKNVNVNSKNENANNKNENANNRNENENMNNKKENVNNKNVNMNSRVNKNAMRSCLLLGLNFCLSIIQRVAGWHLNIHFLCFFQNPRFHKRSANVNVNNKTANSNNKNENTNNKYLNHKNTNMTNMNMNSRLNKNSMHSHLHLALKFCLSMLHRASLQDKDFNNKLKDNSMLGHLHNVPAVSVNVNNPQIFTPPPTTRNPQDRLSPHPHTGPILNINDSDFHHEDGYKPDYTLFMGSGTPHQTACHCGALHWAKESHVALAIHGPGFGMCCKHGEVDLLLLRRPPEYLLRLLTSNDHQAKEFREHIVQYNSALAFTSVGVSVDDEVNHWSHGPPVFRIHSELKHFSGLLLPCEGKAPSYTQLYILDPHATLVYCMHHNGNLQHDTMENLQTVP